MNKLPILIAGAGPVGMLAANLLGQHGIPVVLIEEDEGLTTLPKAVLIDDTSLRALQLVKLFDKIADKMILGYGSRYINKQGECFLEIGYELSEQGYPKRNAFSQPDLEQVLFDGLKRFDCVQIHMKTRLKGLEQNEKSVTITCEDREGNEIKYTGVALLACDGGKSTVRKLLGITMRGPSEEQDWLVIDVGNDSDAERYTKFFCMHKGAYLSIPQPNRGRRYEYLLLPGEDPKKAASFKSVKKRLAPIRDLKEKDLIRSTVYRFHALVVEKMVDHRVMLLGDAAHLTPPFAGQGFNAGLRDAFSAFWRVALLSDGVADVSFLQSYHQERHDQCREMINFALNLGLIMMPKDEFEERVTNRMFNLIGLIPEAKDYIHNMRFKPKMHLREGFKIHTPGLSLDVDPCGKKLPQPRIMLKEGSEVLLDELLGPGFSQVGLGLDTIDFMSQWEGLSLGSFQIQSVVLLLPHESFPSDTNDCIVYGKLAEEYLISKDYRFLPKPHSVALVRPDRYCFALLTADKLTLEVDKIKKLVDRMQKSWNESDQSAVG
jgi:3-(3-hydroxy-phenyl)propionate hydroxylase